MNIQFTQTEWIITGCTALIAWCLYSLGQLLERICDHLYDIQSEVARPDPLADIDDADAVRVRLGRL